MEPDDLEQLGAEYEQTDETQGITEGDGDGEISEGLDESAEDGSEANGEGDETDAIAQAAAQSQVNGKSRAQERIRRQQEELQRERQARESAERERQQLMHQLEQQRQAVDQQRQQQYLDTLDPADRQAFMLQQQMEQMRREMQQSQFAQADLMDKTQFQTRALGNPMVAKYADRVEDTLATMRAKGQTAPRESILKFLIGEEVLNKAPAAVQKATRAASSRSASKPLRARGNASSQAGENDADLEDRLSKISF